MSRLISAVVICLLSVSAVSAQPVAEPKASEPPQQPAKPCDGKTETLVVPSFSSLFRELGHDFGQVGSFDNILLLAAAGGLSLAVLPLDRQITEQLASSPALDHAFEPGDVLGAGAVLGSAALATYIVGRAKNDRRLAIVGADLVRAQLVNAGLTYSIKFAVRRDRPDGGPLSFPSGHSSAAFATATVLQRDLGWRVGAPAYGVAAYVAVSRLTENQHFLSDVIFGAAVGLVAGRAVTIRHGGCTMVVVPVVAPGVSGFRVIWRATR
jgi:membrane-associated phospholipid phosphatase